MAVATDIRGGIRTGGIDSCIVENPHELGVGDGGGQLDERGELAG